MYNKKDVEQICQMWQILIGPNLKKCRLNRNEKWHSGELFFSQFFKLYSNFYSNSNCILIVNCILIYSLFFQKFSKLMLIVNTAGDARLNWRTFPLKWSALNIYSFYSDNFWINSRRVERNAIKTCNNQRNPIKTFSLFFNIQPSSKIIRVSSELK